MTIPVRSGCAADHAYFEHDADIGLIGRGATLEEAFESAALAMFAIMTDVSAVRDECTVRLEFEEADIELALVIIRLHAVLGVEIPERDYAELATLNGAVEYLARRSGGSDAQPAGKSDA